MIQTRSCGTGVDNLKLSANFFSSVSRTSLSAFALPLRNFSAAERCCVAKLLNSFNTSFSTVEVALGVAGFFAGGVLLSAAAGPADKASDAWPEEVMASEVEASKVAEDFGSVDFSSTALSAWAITSTMPFLFGLVVPSRLCSGVGVDAFLFVALI